MKQNSVFKKRGENLGGGERVGISYDSVCTLRKKLIYNRRHLVSALQKKARESLFLRRQISNLMFLPLGVSGL